MARPKATVTEAFFNASSYIDALEIDTKARSNLRTSGFASCHLWSPDTTAKAFQDGQELATAIYSQAPQGYDAQSPLAQLQPKAQGTVTVGYVLKDHSPVTVEITDLLSLDAGAKVKHVYNL
ncbi:DUF5067 domain-containing protein [Bifidobacterium bohemicum]|uniref:DUF5067 domain-containing protein n=1 Tax=Bifidobacterium bohemicum TaxID=638617 RepID=UPI0009DDC696